MKYNENIDWKDVELKIAIICNKFSNLSRFSDDLAQELRIHAYYVSSNYHDLYRKAIDFWRKVQTKNFREIPYYDLELFDQSVEEDNLATDQFEKIVQLLKEELETSENKWEQNKKELSKIILDIILDDIDTKNKLRKPEVSAIPDRDLYYRNHRINLSMLSDELGVGYKRLSAALKLIEDLVKDFGVRGLIYIPPMYYK